MAKILVIDDEKNVREMIQLALQNVGHEVEIADSAKEGLAKFGEGNGWDLVVLDQRLPGGMEGTQVFQEMIKRQPATRALLITAYNSVNVAIESIKAGVVSILKKPFSTDQLRCAVSEALQKVPKPSPAVDTDRIMEAICKTSTSGFTFNVHHSAFDDKLREWTISIESQVPDGTFETVEVTVPRYTIELAKALADFEGMPGNEQFWTALAEEALSHFTVLNECLPPNNVLVVEDIDSHLQRWLDSVLSVHK